MFSWDGWFAAETEEAHVQEVIDNLLNLTYFIYFGNLLKYSWLGTSLPWSDFNSDALPLWRLILTSICILLLRRLPIILALYKYIPPLYTLHDAALVGWFGPVGVGALWYMSAAAIYLPENTTIVPVIMFIVLFNVIAFGITVPFVHMTILTINTMSRSRSFEVPQWPANTPISASMISGPSMVPLTRITSNLSYSGGRLSAMSQIELNQVSLATASDALQISVNAPPDVNASGSEDTGAPKLSTRPSVVFQLDQDKAGK